MKTKICPKCEREKEVVYFCKDKSRKDGFYPQCKDCCKEYKDSHKKLTKEYAKQYYQLHKEERKAYNKLYNDSHKTEGKKYSEIYYQSHKVERNKYEKDRRDNDINYKIVITLRGRLRLALKNNNKKDKK